MQAETRLTIILLLYYYTITLNRLIREGLKKKLWKGGQADRFGGGGGVTSPQPDHFYLWKFWPIFLLYKTAK